MMMLMLGCNLAALGAWLVWAHLDKRPDPFAPDDEALRAASWQRWAPWDADDRE
jgi:hypothetical protein